MPLKELVALPQIAAEGLTPMKLWGIISIRGPGDEVNLKEGWGAILVLEFHDITNYTSGYTSFDKKLAEKTITWLDKHVKRGEIDRLVVHCAAGISRSQAVALFAHDYYAKHLPQLKGTELHNTQVFSMLKRTLLDKE